MVDCEKLLPGGIYREYSAKFDNIFSFDKLMAGRHRKKYLCPINLKSLLIEGDYSSENFQYVKIELNGCKLEPSECATDEEIATKTFDVIMSDATPDVSATTRQNTINYTFDRKHYFYLDPNYTLQENVFFETSTLRMRQSSLDIFVFTEYEQNIIEGQST